MKLPCMQCEDGAATFQEWVDLDSGEKMQAISTCFETCQEYLDYQNDEMPDYVAIYDEYWKGIIEPGGKFSKDQMMRELADFHFLIKNVPKVYDHATGGQYSKPMYRAEAMMAVIDDFMQKTCEEHHQEECDACEYTILSSMIGDKWQ